MPYRAALRATIRPQPFYFVRHGETDANKAHILQGHMDIPLNDTGLAQAESAAQTLQNINIKAVVASDLARAKQTAAVICDALFKKSDMDIIPELKERHFGVYQGKLRDELDFIRENEFSDIEGGEPYEVFITRIASGLSKALQHEAPVVIVSHGGVFRGLGHLLGFGPLKASNAAVYRLTPVDGSEQWTVEHLNR